MDGWDESKINFVYFIVESLYRFKRVHIIEWALAKMGMLRCMNGNKEKEVENKL